MDFHYELMDNNNNNNTMFNTNQYSHNQYYATMKRKAWSDIDDSDYTNTSSSDSEASDTGEFTDVVRRMKRIKFPVYIVIKTLNGRSITLDLDSNDTIEHLKYLLQEREGIPIDQQKLIFAGKQIQDVNTTVYSYGIVNGSIIYLIVALPNKHGYTGVAWQHRVE